MRLEHARWLSAAAGIDLGSFRLGKYTWEVAALEKAFGKYLTSSNLLLNKPCPDLIYFIQAVYEWIRGKVGTSRLLVWGHSLGTAVSSHLVSDLCLEGNRPDGLILG